MLSKAYKTFDLLHRSFAKALSIHTKKVLYISLVRSKLTYCSPIWRPQHLKDMQLLQTLQRRATKFILNDYKSCYRSLLTLRMLPLMTHLEIIDILFFVTSIKHPTERFDILKLCHLFFSINAVFIQVQACSYFVSNKS